MASLVHNAIGKVRYLGREVGRQRSTIRLGPEGRGLLFETARLGEQHPQSGVGSGASEKIANGSSSGEIASWGAARGPHERLGLELVK